MKNFNTPYYAVIFTSVRNDVDNGYAEMATKMEELAAKQPGYLGYESASGKPNISVSYWESLEDISNWKKNEEHLVTQQKGVNEWYKNYQIRVCKVEREYSF
ncbi:MAG: antibiotic biosynthesis monooxygenase [Flavobacteriales bacterium]|nr:antibiotic biosynthesis monooxygenase [Flavobacteriales bacterium]